MTVTVSGDLIRPAGLFGAPIIINNKLQGKNRRRKTMEKKKKKRVFTLYFLHPHDRHRQCLFSRFLDDSSANKLVFFTFSHTLAFMECYETWKFSLGEKIQKENLLVWRHPRGHWFSPGSLPSSLSLIVENLHIGHLEGEQETKTTTQVWLLFLVSWRGKCSSRNEPVGLVFKRRNSKDYYSEI